MPRSNSTPRHPIELRDHLIITRHKSELHVEKVLLHQSSSSPSTYHFSFSIDSFPRRSIVFNWLRSGVSFITPSHRINMSVCPARKSENICDKKWHFIKHILLPFQSTEANTAGVEMICRQLELVSS